MGIIFILFFVIGIGNFGIFVRLCVDIMFFVICGFSDK